MENEKTYTDHEVAIIRENVEVKTLIQNIDDKLSRICALNEKQHDTICQENERQHEAMWKKIDYCGEKIVSHSKIINKIIGGIIVVGSIYTFFLVWLKEALRRGL
jgi:hypothetical protein